MKMIPSPEAGDKMILRAYQDEEGIQFPEVEAIVIPSEDEMLSEGRKWQVGYQITTEGDYFNQTGTVDGVEWDEQNKIWRD